jgi:hypothetical protein
VFRPEDAQRCLFNVRIELHRCFDVRMPHHPL